MLGVETRLPARPPWPAKRKPRRANVGAKRKPHARTAAVLGDELDARDRAIWRGAPLVGVPRQYSSHVVIVVMVVVMIVMNVMMMIVMVVMVLLGDC